MLRSSAYGSAPLTPIPLSSRPNLAANCGRESSAGQQRDLPTLRRERSWGRFWTPAAILSNFSSKLTSFESSEILQYPQVYYWGQNVQDRVSTVAPGGTHVFDDENGDYYARRGDHIAYRFELYELLGKGSFGQVYKVLDTKTLSFVALKVIRNKRTFTKQGESEVRIHSFIRELDPDGGSNCVRMLGHFSFRNHLCIAFEMLSKNLFQFLKGRSFLGLPMDEAKIIARQILKCLSFLRKSQIIHCDLKPENVLLTGRDALEIRVIDLGSSCMISEKAYTYIQSRFYRAPEILLGFPYSTPIDMWSFGCIMFELVLGVPMFAGENEVDQIWRIMEMLGTPDERMLACSSRAKNLLGGPTGLESELPHHRDTKGRMRYISARPLQKLRDSFSDEFYRFMQGCLQWNPEMRFTPDEALAHPFLKLEESIEAIQQPQPAVSRQPHPGASCPRGRNRSAPAFELRSRQWLPPVNQAVAPRCCYVPNSSRQTGTSMQSNQAQASTSGTRLQYFAHTPIRACAMHPAGPPGIKSPATEKSGAIEARRSMYEPSEKIPAPSFTRQSRSSASRARYADGTKGVHGANASENTAPPRAAKACTATTVAGYKPRV